MHPRDLAVLGLIQREFPLVPRPYDALARRAGLKPEEVLCRVRSLLSRGVIRRIAPMLDRQRLGLKGVLVAAKVSPGAVGRAAKLLDARDEVTHNYLRTGLRPGKAKTFNLWFTATLRRGESVRPLVGEMLAVPGVREVVVLPTRRVFKLDASFLPRKAEARRRPAGPVRLDATDKRLLATLREDFPTSAAPWAEAGRRVKLSEGEALRRLRRMKRSGPLLDVRAALDQRKLGLKGNILVAWRVEESRAAAAGARFARRPEASHVVLRGASEDWPYNLYTMVHARTLAAARRAVREMADETGLADYVELVTKRELKKSAPRYF